jgi:glycosyltransferase involved in cell wall biosynthesis
MPTLPRVSVVLPVRNGAATLGRAIESIRGQTFRDWELLVIDDHSIDATAEVLGRLAAEETRLRIVRAPSPGLVPALNAGIEAAHGDFIARMDADDTAHPARLAAQCALLDAEPELGLASCLVDFGGNLAAQAGYALHVAWLNALLTPEAIALNRFVESPLAHPSVMFRRDLPARHGGYRAGEFPEDYELWLRWLDAGVRMAKVPRPLLTWNDAPTRLSRSDPRYSPEAFFRIKAPWIAREVQRVAPQRPVWIWGAGRPTRRRAAELESHGLRIAGYIDIDPKKETPSLGGRGPAVVAPSGIPVTAFVLGYVSSRGARDLIRAALQSGGRTEGRDFLMCA